MGLTVRKSSFGSFGQAASTLADLAVQLQDVQVRRAPVWVITPISLLCYILYHS